MGPAASSSDIGTVGDNPPVFKSNVTNKVQYKDDLRTWADLTRSFTAFEKKAKAKLESLGLIVYLSCDDGAKSKLRAAETEGKLKLSGMDNDADRKALIEAIINTIARETPNEKIQREVTLLTDIHKCRRSPKETAEAYACRFESNVAKYVHQKSVRSARDDQQWALLMIQNANLSADTYNALTFQLTTMAAHDHAAKKTKTFAEIDTQTCKKVIETIKAVEQAPNMGEVRKIFQENIEHLATLRKRTNEAEEAESPTIQFSDAVAALRQAHVDTSSPVSTMLATQSTQPQAQRPAKRSRIDELKERTKCLACGNKGHWFKDRPDCLREMNNRGEKKKDNENEKVSSFFRQRGQ